MPCRPVHLPRFRFLSSLSQCALLSLLLLAMARAESPSVALPADSFLSHFAELNGLNHRGQRFDAMDLQGQVTLFNFIYTGCGQTCPMQTQTLKQVLEAIPEQAREHVRFVSVSLDPVTDTVERLRAFSRQFKVDQDAWQFVSASAATTRTMLNAIGVAVTGPSGAQRILDHSTDLWLVGRTGHLMMRYDGINIDRDRLTREIAQLVSL